jgi:glycosyltransferase involved in cell wall biosynthesis
MRIVQLNLAFDAAFRDPEQLLERYHTLTGWSRALTAAGADVRVVQRFSTDATIKRDGVVYAFVKGGKRGRPAPWNVSSGMVAAVAGNAPDLIHVNGLMFPGMIRATRAVVGHARVIVAQDHSGRLPRRRVWPLQSLAQSRWARALGQLDACTFTSRELASRWHAAGLPKTVPIIEIPEASTTFAPVDRVTARSTTGISGTPALLWVGRVDANKDPLTVLTGFGRALTELPDARLWMVIPAHVDDSEIRAHIGTTAVLRDRVTILGPVDYRDMPRYYSAADVFISGSHHEGSGYALLEAMACGVVPCVTDIAAFRALVGDCGVLWRAGDAAAMAAALRDLTARDLHEQRQQVRQRFDKALSWPAVGQRTFDAYASLLERRRTASAR